MYGCESWTTKKADHKESWCFWTVVLEKTTESPLDCKEIQPVHPKGNQSWIFIGRTDAEAEAPKPWSPDAKSPLYLRLLIFLPAILIPACVSSSPAFLIMYSAYKLKKQGDNIQPWCTSFPIWNQPVVPCPVLTVTSWLAHKFLKRQVRWSGIPISFRIFHSLLWSTQSKALA